MRGFYRLRPVSLDVNSGDKSFSPFLLNYQALHLGSLVIEDNHIRPLKEILRYSEKTKNKFSFKLEIHDRPGSQLRHEQSSWAWTFPRALKSDEE